MVTWILALLIVAAVYFAGKHVLRNTKNGGCVGCDSGERGGCPHCRHETYVNLHGKG